ncbi:MAG TPA: sulfotransferase [Spongiibacteraceae bacterium]|jgi:hypothetical protein|nr:sulfotransferase [Spongiibacteraceae bacterium]HUH37755.1 sulfotransferase [Spongiibacteraceae bacterium]
MSIDLRIWWRICRLAHREQLAFRPKLRRLAIFWLGSLFVLLNQLLLMLDHLLFPGFRRLPIRAPVFVIGNMRSGTTHMHRLLWEDRGHTTSLALWEILFPSLCARKLIRGLACIDRRLLGGRILAWLHRTQDRKFGKARRMHQWNLFEPEEDEFVFYHTMRSASLLVLFPYFGQFDDLSWADREPEKIQRKMLAFYDGIIRRQLYLHGADKRYLAKSPTFVAKIRMLSRHYPGATFVYMARNPHEMLASGANLLQKTWGALGIDDAALRANIRLLNEQQLALYEYASEALSVLPDDRVAYIEYGDLNRSPDAVVRKIYAQFHWPLEARYAQYLALAQDRASAGHQSQHRYQASEFGPGAAEVETRLADLFTRYGWPSQTGQSADTSPETE